MDYKCPECGFVYRNKIELREDVIAACGGDRTHHNGGSDHPYKELEVVDASEEAAVGTTAGP